MVKSVDTWVLCISETNPPSNNWPGDKLHSSCRKTPTAHCCLPGGASSLFGSPPLTMLSVLLWCLWLFSQPPSCSVFGSINVALLLTLPPIDAHGVPLCDPWQCPPYDTIIDSKLTSNQRLSGFVWHILHHFKAMRMWLTIAADNNVGSNSVDDWSPLTSRESLLSCS